MCLPSGLFCGVTPVNDVMVLLEDAPWPFATQNGEKISAFWRAKQTSHPHFYDGQVHVMRSWEIRDAETIPQPLLEICIVLILLAFYTGRTLRRIPERTSISPEVQRFCARTEPC